MDFQDNKNIKHAQAFLKPKNNIENMYSKNLESFLKKAGIKRYAKSVDTARMIITVKIIFKLAGQSRDEDLSLKKLWKK